MRRVTKGLFALGSLVLLVQGGAFAKSAADAVVAVQGSSASDHLGISLAVAGDVDGDGAADFVLGSSGGYVLVISGANAKTIHTVKGSTSDEFGVRVAGVPDTNGDGYDDFVVGAPSEYDAGGKAQTGAAHLYSGKDGTLLYDFFGDNDSDYFGCSVAGVGDLDGDGCGDVLVGARYATDPNTGGTPGMAKVFSGKSGKELYALYGDVDYDEFGASVAGLADLDGDGAAEFVVGAEYADDGTGIYPGSVRIFHGASSKVLQTLYGDQDYDSFGVSVAPVGDVDGDKVPDLVVGADYGADASGNYPGYARVFSGSDWSTLYTIYGDADYDYLGHAVSGSEDLDGDGVPDLIVGCPGMLDESGNATGTVRLVSGADGSVLETIYGSNPDDFFGWSVAPVADVTGDKIPDVVVGIPLDDAVADDAGAVVLLSGGTAKPPTGGVLIQNDAPATSTSGVTLALSWTAGTADVTEMRIRNAGDAWGDWTSVADSSSWTLASGEGTRSVEAQFRDALGLESDVATDSIVVDSIAPTGTVSIAAGAAWTNTLDVQLSLTTSDAGTGVVRFRVRNAGGAFGAPFPAASSVAWTLANAGGANTVEVQFEDGAGNFSSVVSDSISVDQVAPSGTIVIQNGDALVRQRSVTLGLSASDTGGAGVTSMRFRRGSGAPWDAWQPYTGAVAWALEAGDGTKVVQAQFRDAALNESAVVSDTVILDEGLPTITSLALHDPRPYYLPLESIGFDLVAADAPGGTGIDAARTSWDGGATWTPWTDISGGGVYTPDRPSLEGVVAPRVVVRDLAGNESESFATVSMEFVPLAPPDAGSGGTGTGAMSGFGDVDVIAVDLVQGDALSATLKSKAGVKKQSFLLALDLARPDGARLFTDRYPSNLKTPGIKKFIAPESGRYLVIVRHADAAGAPTGTYSLKLSVKHAKPNASGKGTADAGAFSFDAAAGSSFSATLKGAGLDAGSITVEGPDGPVAVTVKASKTGASIRPAKLTAGTGTYTVKFTATGPVTFTWKATLPKGNAKVTPD